MNALFFQELPALTQQGLEADLTLISHGVTPAAASRRFLR